MAALGLSNDARIHVQAPGVDVVITGDPEKVRSVLEAVKAEIEYLQRGRRGESRARNRGLQPGPGGARIPNKPDTDSQVVRPTELDEMDSPYALPGHRGKKGELVKTKVNEAPKGEATPSSEVDITADSSPALRSTGEDPEPEPTRIDQKGEFEGARTDRDQKVDPASARRGS